MRPGLQSVPDIAIECPGAFAILIENKIEAGPGVDQPQREEADLQALRERIGAGNGWCVYLSEIGGVPVGAGPAWRGLTHSQLASEFRSMSLVDGKMKDLLDDWCDVVQKRLGSATKLELEERLPAVWDKEFGLAVSRLRIRFSETDWFQSGHWELGEAPDVNLYVSTLLESGSPVQVGLLAACDMKHTNSCDGDPTRACDKAHLFG